MNETDKPTPGTLQIGEYHPAADSAMNYMREFLNNNIRESMILMESFASTAISGNRLSDICLETLQRLMRNDLVSDRYLLGLAWTIKEMQEHKVPIPKVKNKRKKK